MPTLTEIFPRLTFNTKKQTAEFRLNECPTLSTVIHTTNKAVPNLHTDRQRQADRQSDRHADRQSDRRIDFTYLR